VAHSEETARFEALLRERGVDPAGRPDLERELIERYRDTCALLVLDSSGFTRLTREHGIVHFMSLVVAMRDIAIPIVLGHGALTAWPEADNCYAVFRTAGAAVRAAVGIQIATAAENAKRPEASRLWVSIGVGFGEVLRIGDENVWGDEMNLACKLGEDTAGPREILVTDAAHRAASPHLPELGFEPLRVREGGVEIPCHRVRYTGPVSA